MGGLGQNAGQIHPGIMPGHMRAIFPEPAVGDVIDLALVGEIRLATIVAVKEAEFLC
jgi:hypothetical protein